jgi:hypothetical protein
VYAFERELAKLSLVTSAPQAVETAGGNRFQARNTNGFVNDLDSSVVRTPQTGALGGAGSSTFMPDPAAGNVYQFQSLIPLDKPAQIDATVLTTKTSDASKGIIGVLLVIGALVFARFSKARDQWKVGIYLFFALVMLALQSMTQYAYAGQLEVIVYVLWTVTILYALFAGGRQAVPAAVRSWRAHSQRSGSEGASGGTLWSAPPSGGDKPAGSPPTSGSAPGASGASPKSEIIPLDKYEKKE